uniref:Manganese transporter n=1 Tax=Thermorudis sp. TaxID=1969470 RepID=A0A7C3ABA0_9BACT
MVVGLLVLALNSPLVACRPVAGQTGDIATRQVRVVATTTIVADAVREVGGDRVEVITLMGPGIDPHLYKASEGDVLRLASADIIFYNGLHLEGKMSQVLARVGERVPTVAIAERIDPSFLRKPPEFEGAYDPHVWFDVRLWMIAIEAVRDGLATVDPTHAAVYQANAERYLAELDELDRWVRQEVAKIPPERRVLITAHDAFGYFARAYGFEVYGLQGVSTAAEAGVADVQALADLIVERRIPAIFVETSVPPRFIEAVQEAVRARGFAVRIGGQLYSDALGDPGTPAGTYVGMVRSNVETIVQALASTS